MNKDLYVLIVEDSENDTLLLLHELQRCGYRPHHLQVEDPDSLRKALATGCWDIVISDYKMPRLDGLAALKIVRENGRDLPFILVSRSIGEEIAVAAMKAGAHDYIMKGNLARLGPAIERELREAQERMNRHKAEEALLQSKRNYREIFNATSEAIFIHDPQSSKIVDINDAVLQLYGYTTREEVFALKEGQLTAECTPSVLEEGNRLVRLAIAGQPQVFEWRARKKNGETFPVEITLRLSEIGGQRRLLSVVRDITERKRQEDKQKLLGEILDTAPNAIIVHDLKGRMLYANRRTLLMHGFEEKEFLALDLQSLDAPESAQQIAHRMALIEQRGEARFEVSHLRKDGSVIPLEIYVKKIVWAGTPAILSIGSDISERKRQETELRKSESLLRRIFDLTPVGLWFADVNGTILRTNPAGRRIWGGSALVPIEEYGVYKARRLPSRQEVLAEDWALAWAVRRKATILDELLEIDTFDGHKKIVLNSAAPILDDDGVLLGGIAVNQDVTALKGFEDALQEAALLRDTAVRVANIGLWDWDLAANRVRYSPEWKKQIGFEEEEITNSFEEWTSRMHPAEKAPLLEKLQNFASTPNHTMRIEYRMLHRQGHYIWVLFHGLTQADPVGRPCRAIGAHLDITELKNAEERQRLSNEVLRAIRDINRLITTEKNTGSLIRKAVQILVHVRGFYEAWILLIDQDGTCLDSADESLTPIDEPIRVRYARKGLPACARAVRDRPSTFICQETSDPDTFSSMDKVGLPHGTMCQRLSYNGKLYGYLTVAARPELLRDTEEQTLFSEIGIDLSFAMASLEIEEARQRQEKELLAAKEESEIANNAKSEFLAVISHELRTPLNPILGFARMLHSEATSETQRSYFDIIIQAAERQLDLIENILNYIRLDRQTYKPNFSEVSLIEVCKAALRDVELNAHGLELRLRNPGGGKLPIPQDLLVRAESNMLRRILDNLLNNACKYTKKGSVELAIGMEKRNATSRLFTFAIKDTGIGIAKNLQERLFTPFTQGDTGYTREFEGAGLGLAICRKLVELLGGQIGLESEPGQGSIFWFNLPMDIVGSKDRPVSNGSMSSSLAVFDFACHVLIVEDQIDNSLFLKANLARFGVECTIAPNGADALRLCETQRFNLIFMDLSMPVMDGLEAARQIRRTPNLNRDTPIVALTAAATDTAREHCMAAGMEGYLTKPVRAEHLHRVIANLCQKKGPR